MPDQNLLHRAVTEIIGRESLQKKLGLKKPLRVKYGIDPTGDLIHLGHAVVLYKLKEFQDKGHEIILLIGDFTAQIGDPSGRSKARIPLTTEKIRENMAHYLTQAALILDMERIEVRYNSEWYDPMSATNLMELMSLVTYTQVSQRADFQKRLELNEPISLKELIYPLLQGYDSVMLNADVELGGTDQKFNLLMGRQLQERFGQTPQDIIMTPILEGLDGHEKMSKSLNNFIALTDTPHDMYGKIMSLPDTLMAKFFSLVTRVPEKDIQEILKQTDAGTLNPRDAKMALAREVVAMLHGIDSAQAAELHFVETFQNHQTPKDIEVITIEARSWNAVDLIMTLNLCATRSDARRLIEQGGITIHDKTLQSHEESITISSEPVILKKGKRHYVKIVGV